MATIVFSALGAALGASAGGGVLGLSSVVIGRAVGATLGRVLDQRLLGAGSEPVETGRLERLRLNGSSEGAPITRHFGRMRLSGQVIWASPFREDVARSGGGKGAAPSPKINQYSYSISIAVGLCEGKISRVGRIWADGQEIAKGDLNLRVYPGTDDQLPDPAIEADIGAGQVPAYRGTAYVVIEDLQLAAYGNRVPQLSFEVIRPAPETLKSIPADPSQAIQAIALIPGTGEYSLATTPVHFDRGAGVTQSANVNSPSAKTDFATSLEMLTEELPNCKSVSMVVSWFGNDLRCGQCKVRPLVEQAAYDGIGMRWKVSGLTRKTANTVPHDGGRPVYGGTPADKSVVEAITVLRDRKQSVVFYPFMLMEQMPGNGLPDPWTGADNQPVLPWRGRITLSVAPGRDGTPDQTATAEAEVSEFFGTAVSADFIADPDGTVSYSGPDEFSYRRFILHYAHLCALAGGVDAFLIGSELRGVTQIRGADGSFPAVEALRQLSSDVRLILGPDTKIGYAADWSEYFGYHPQDGSGDVWFHLDPLWADANIDFVGIDNYMPLSDWREGRDHADAHWGSIYDLEYLKSNVAGGEGYDWYYHAPEADALQMRTAIEDGAYSEPWVFRYKDLKGWWSNPHHNRIGGVRADEMTPWVPGSKPFWFTELGCAAIDKGTNEPNKFLDAKSSESSLPRYSNGRRDDFLQMQYVRAVFDFWADSANNPAATEYQGRMVDMERAHVWAWDARPFPFFPNNSDLWSDGENYARGHWLNGRSSARSLASVVAELCESAGVQSYDVTHLFGLVRGYVVNDLASARSALQPLMVAYGFEAIERDGKLVFQSRGVRPSGVLDLATMVAREDEEGDFRIVRAPSAELSGRLRLNFVEAEADYEVRSAEAVFPDEVTRSISQSELPLALNASEARSIVERWLAESRIARDVASFSLPPSRLPFGAGDVFEIESDGGLEEYRIDRVEQAGAQLIEAVRTERETYEPSDTADTAVRNRPFIAPLPVFPLFLDLPLLSGDEVPHAPHIAVTSDPWPGAAAVFSSSTDDNYELNKVIPVRATVGVTETNIARAASGRLDHANTLRVRLTSGELSSATMLDLLNGANAVAIGDGSSDNWEIVQFRDALLVAPNTYELTTLLRGQAGTDAVSPAIWPEGSFVVLLDQGLRQIELAVSARRLARHYRIGPAQRPYDDASYRHSVEAFDGVGLRPLSPVHLAESSPVSGDRQFSWVRRTRKGGDSWEFEDVPLAEASEKYRVRIAQNGQVVRENTVDSPAWTYQASEIAADALSGEIDLTVAQLSDSFGAGAEATLVVQLPG